MTFDLASYLIRIAHTAETPSAKALSRLQAAQLAAIPFENIDPFLGIIPDLSPDAIWSKIVNTGRGGYCLELNRLFGIALKNLGYDARPVLGRVRMGAPQGGPRAHLAHLVRVDDKVFLADTGFGGPAPEAPLELGNPDQVIDRLGCFRLRNDLTTDETVLERKTPDGWFALYGFDLVAVSEADQIAANFFCACYPGSPFPNHLMMNRVTPNGRVSQFNLRLTTSGGERDIATWQDLSAILADEFGLPKDAALTDRLWQKISSYQCAA